MRLSWVIAGWPNIAGNANSKVGITTMTNNAQRSLRLIGRHQRGAAKGATFDIAPTLRKYNTAAPRSHRDQATRPLVD